MRTKLKGVGVVTSYLGIPGKYVPTKLLVVSEFLMAKFPAALTCEYVVIDLNHVLLCSLKTPKTITSAEAYRRINDFTKDVVNHRMCHMKSLWGSYEYRRSKGIWARIVIPSLTS